MAQDPKDLPTPVWLRKRSGKTQREIAVELGTTESTVSKWEKGVQTPHPSLLEIPRFCRAYDCTVDELVKAFVNLHAQKQKVNGFTDLERNT